jgi:thiol-disulfide isomerase/thioredoxin
VKRRTAITAGVAAAAAAGGLGWWHLRQTGADDAVADALWALSFERPDGGPLAMAALRGQPLLLNFWATWCPPCITELPLLAAFHARERSRGWRVVGLAVDSPTPVREFLSRQPLGFDVGLAGLDGIALSRSLGNTAGALPFSVAFDRHGRAFARHLGVLDRPQLDSWAASGT